MITTYDADGHRAKQQRVPNSRARLRRYFAEFTGPHQAVVESTGFWYWLADMLEELGVLLQHFGEGARLDHVLAPPGGQLPLEELVQQLHRRVPLGHAADLSQ